MTTRGRRYPLVRMMLNRTFALRTLSLLAVSISLTGCMSSVHKQANALADATTPVVEQAAAAYRSANVLYDTTVDYKAVADFDKTPPYNPRTSTDVLLPERDIQIRLKVLQAFQLYVQSIVDITSGTNSPALDAAAKSVGSNMLGLANDLAPSIGVPAGASSSTSSADTVSTVTNQAGVATTTTTDSTTTITKAAPAISSTAGNITATAANALGQFLVSRTIKKQLPGIIVKMDPQIKTLCELLLSDVDVLQQVEKRDYNTLINLETSYIRSEKTLDAPARRDAIMKLPNIVRQQRNADAQLNGLRASITNLYRTHHALAAVAQGNNPASLKQSIGELATAGSNLGTFYSSLN